MNFLPFAKIALKTELSQDELIKKLSNTVRQEKAIWFGLFARVEDDPQKTYQGKIFENKFVIKKIGNSKRDPPLVIGKIQQGFVGSIINIQVRHEAFFYIFFFFYFAFAGILGIIFLINEKGFKPYQLIPLAMFVLFYTIIMASFNSASRESIKDLQVLFDAEPLDK